MRRLILCAKARHRGVASSRNICVPSGRPNGEDVGAIMILALVFLVAVSLVIVALISWVGTSLTATAAFSTERTNEYAATSAVDLAINNSRYQFDNGVSPSDPMHNAVEPAPCWNTAGQIGGGAAGQPPAIDGVTMDVWCSMQWQPQSSQTRVITYSVCPSSVSNVSCGAQPLLQAVVAFDDYPPGLGTVSLTPVPCSSRTATNGGTCGESQTQISWQWNPEVPEVSGLQYTSGTAGSSIPLTINGTDFVNGMTVTFTEEANNVPYGSDPNVMTLQNVTGVTCTTASTCSVIVPAPTNVTVGPSYFVTVTTPGGSSQAETMSGTYPSGTPSGSYIVFSYGPPTPAVTSLSGTTSGAITGGANVTVNGSGFYSTPNFQLGVQFCLLPGGTTCYSPLSPPTVISPTQLNVVSPPVSSAGTYFIQVKTIGLTGGTQTTSDDFTYSVQVPIIFGLNTTTGPSGTPVTISGYNLLANSTVVWAQDVNGVASNTTTNSTSVTYNAGVGGNPPSITAVVPVLPNNNQPYFPIITDPSPNQTLTSQPYNESSDIFNYTT
jgi:hypothetical protein